MTTPEFQEAVGSRSRQAASQEIRFSESRSPPRSPPRSTQDPFKIPSRPPLNKIATQKTHNVHTIMDKLRNAPPINSIGNRAAGRRKGFQRPATDPWQSKTCARNSALLNGRYTFSVRPVPNKILRSCATGCTAGTLAQRKTPSGNGFASIDRPSVER